MEAIAITVICATIFGVVATLAAFVRQLVLSRDKALNDLAQKKALKQETLELKNLREEMLMPVRFNSHYQVLGANKAAIQYIDQHIEDILIKKSSLIKRYAEIVVDQSSFIVFQEQGLGRKYACDRLKEEIDKDFQVYEKELLHLQERRAKLWDTHLELQTHLLAQEKRRNKHLDVIYTQHTALLEKIYLRHSESNEAITKKILEASNETFKSALMAPFHFLSGFFKVSLDISTDAMHKENKGREKVKQAQKDLLDEDADALVSELAFSS